MKLKMAFLITTALALTSVSAQAASYNLTTDGPLSTYWDVTLDLPGVDYAALPTPDDSFMLNTSSAGTLTIQNRSSAALVLDAFIPEFTLYLTPTSIYLTEPHTDWLDVEGYGHRIGANTLDQSLTPTSVYIEGGYIAPSNYTGFWTLNPEAAAVPEPASMLLIGSGLAGLAGTRLKRKKLAAHKG